MFVRRVGVAILAVIILLLPSVVATGQVSKGGTLIFARSGEPAELDPALTSSLWTAVIRDQLFDPLIRYKTGSGDTFEPALAEKWEASPDGLTWTFSLRRNVKFHDGTPFDADAVMFSFQRIIDSRHPFHKPQMAQRAANLAMIGSIEAVDKFTIRMRLKFPSPVFERVIAAYFGQIVSPTAVQKSGDAFALNPVGTGAFKFRRWVKASLIELQANDGFWGGRPYLDRVIFRVIPEGTVQMAEIEAGRVHVVEGVAGDAANIPKVRSNPQLRLVEGDAYTSSWLGMVTTKAPFGDRRVRLAINLAIDKKKLAQSLYHGAVGVAKQHVPTITKFADKTIVGYGYDPGRARQLLAEAGFPQGFSTNIYTESVPSTWNLAGVDLATALQGYLAAVGIKAEIVRLDPAGFSRVVFGGGSRVEPKMDMYIFGFTSFMSDISNYFRDFLKCGALVNVWAFCDPAVDKLIDEAGATRDEAVRTQNYRELQRIVNNHIPAVFLFNPKNLAIVSSTVQDYQLAPILANLIRLERVWIKR